MYFLKRLLVKQWLPNDCLVFNASQKMTTDYHEFVQINETESTANGTEKLFAQQLKKNN